MPKPKWLDPVRLYGDAKAAWYDARRAAPGAAPPYYTRAQLDEIERASPAPQYVKPVDGGA